MAADRAEHVARVLEPALAAGEWVVSDRYAGSTIAYQGYGQGLDTAALDELVRWATGGLAADLSILVDVSVDVAAARLAAGRPGRCGPAGTPRARTSPRVYATASWPRRRRTRRTGSSSTGRRRSPR